VCLQFSVRNATHESEDRLRNWSHDFWSSTHTYSYSTSSNSETSKMISSTSTSMVCTKPLTCSSCAAWKPPPKTKTTTTTTLDRNHQRIQFLLFVKILCRYLEKQEQYLVLQQVRLAVMTFTHCARGHGKSDDRSTMTYAGGEHLQVDSIRVRLRKLVDDETWNHASNYTRFYLLYRNNDNCYQKPPHDGDHNHHSSNLPGNLPRQQVTRV
jgi:hypothetical protein